MTLKEATGVEVHKVPEIGWLWGRLLKRESINPWNLDDPEQTCTITGQSEAPKACQISPIYHNQLQMEDPRQWPREASEILWVLAASFLCSVWAERVYTRTMQISARRKSGNAACHRTGNLPIRNVPTVSSACTIPHLLFSLATYLWYIPSIVYF